MFTPTIKTITDKEFVGTVITHNGRPSFHIEIEGAIIPCAIYNNIQSGESYTGKIRFRKNRNPVIENPVLYDNTNENLSVFKTTTDIEVIGIVKLYDGKPSFYVNLAGAIIPCAIYNCEMNEDNSFIGTLRFRKNRNPVMVDPRPYGENTKRTVHRRRKNVHSDIPQEQSNRARIDQFLCKFKNQLFNDGYYSEDIVWKDTIQKVTDLYNFTHGTNYEPSRDHKKWSRDYTN